MSDRTQMLSEIEKAVWHTLNKRGWFGKHVEEAEMGALEADLRSAILEASLLSQPEHQGDECDGSGIIEEEREAKAGEMALEELAEELDRRAGQAWTEAEELAREGGYADGKEKRAFNAAASLAREKAAELKD